MKKTSIYLSTAVAVSIILSSSTPVKGETAPLDEVEIPVHEQVNIAKDTPTVDPIVQEKTETTDDEKSKEVKVEDEKILEETKEQDVASEAKEEAVAKLENLEELSIAEKQEPKNVVQAAPALNPGDEVNIPDPRLKNLILRTLKKTDGEDINIPVSVADMESLTELNFSAENGWVSKINSIEGLQYAKNLKKLTLIWNNITDISPITGLPIESLNLMHNPLGNGNTETFKSLDKLNNIDLSSTGVTNYSWITNSPVTGLRAEINGITDADMEPFRTAHNLKVVEMPTNQISDLSIFKDMRNLNTLLVASNNISDLSPLEDFTSPIISFNFDNNGITDLSPIKYVASTLVYFTANSNKIYDFSPLNTPFEKADMIRADDQSIVLPPITIGQDVVPTLENPVISMDKTLIGASRLYPEGGITNGDNISYSWPNKVNESFSAMVKFEKSYVKDIIQVSGEVIQPFVYKPAVQGANVTVKYQDMEGNQLHQPIILKGIIDENYIAEQKVFNGYTFKSVTGNPQGVFTDQPQEVIFIYDQSNAADVTVKHQDENGIEVAPDVILKGKVGTPYVSSPETVPGWVLKTTPDNANGTFTADAQEVVYIYERATVSNVTVKYQDEDGEELDHPTVLTGKVGSDYQAVPKAIVGWVVKTVPANEHGQFKVDPQEVIYIYERADAANVTVKHQDEAGVEVASDVILTGKIGLPYNSQPVVVNGWVLKTTPTNASGTFKSTAQEVIYIYERADAADVTVKFVDDQGVELADNIILSGKIGQPYVTTPAVIDGWVLKTTPDNATGVYTDQAQEVIYIYEKDVAPDGADVTVKYQDEQGTELADSVILKGKVGEAYVSSPAVIDGWVLKTTPDNATGVYTDQTQEVIYIYEKEVAPDGADVTVKYQDEQGTELVDSVILQGKVGETYVSTPAVIDGWVLKTTPDNATGVYTDQTQEVIYIYEKEVAPDGADVSVKFIDEQGTELADSVILKGKVGEAYVSTPAVIDGWVLKTTPDNATGVYTDQTQEVIYIYEKEVAPDGADVSVKFIDEQGTELADSVILKGKVGEAYVSTPAVIDGWVLKTTPDNATGVYTDQTQEVIYVYERAEGAPVSVRFQDTSGKQLSIGFSIKGKIGTAYSTLPKAIKGWTIKSIPSNAKGFFTSEPQEVIFVYDRAIATDVTVKFVDESGNELTDSVILTGKVGLPYESTPATINGWVLKTTPDNAKGTFTTEAQEVVYVYERANAANVTVKFVDENGKELTDSVILSGKIGADYVTQAKTITGWVLKTTPANAKGVFTDVAQEVVYIYEETKAAPVTVKFVDEDGNELSASIILSGKLGEQFETEAKKIEGWVLKTTPTNAKGTFSEEAQEVIYVYKKAEIDKPNPPKPTTPDKKTPNTGISTGIVATEALLVASLACIVFVLKKRSKKEN